MKPTRVLMVGALLACYGPDSRGAGMQAADRVTVDAGTVFQTMQGFGTSERVFDDPHVWGDRFDPATGKSPVIMTAAQQAEVLRLLYVDLGLTRVRPIIEEAGESQAAGAVPENDNADPAVTDLSRFNFEWKRNDAHAQLVQREIGLGVRTHFISPVEYQAWLRNLGETDQGKAEYVEWAMAVLRRWRQLGVEMPYYSVVNEPGYIRSGIWSGEYIRDVIKLLGPKMRAEGFATMIVAPDDVRSTDAAPRTRVILADPEARQYVGALATHLYDEPTSTVGLMKELSEQYGIPLWMTEYSESAWNWADIIHDLIALYNVTAIDYMWGFFSGGPEAVLIQLNSSGTTYVGYTLSKQYYTMGQFSRFVRPGARRIRSDSSNPGAKVTAYLDGSNLSIVAVNNTTSSISLSFNLMGLAGITQVSPTRTTSSESWAALASIPVTGSTFTTTLPAQSVTTFVGTGSAGLLTVTVVATDATASESGPQPATYTVSRTGDTSASLVVNFTMSGSATNGGDYQTVTNSVVIPAGSVSATVTVTPIDDSQNEGTEVAILTLSAGASYVVGVPSSATITILNNDNPLPSGVLLGEWRLDEGAGTLAADSSGNGRTGTLVNGPAWTVGNVNGALEFSGNAYVSVDDFAPPADLTLEAWIYPTADNTGSDSILLSKNNSEYDFRLSVSGTLTGSAGGVALQDASFNFYTAANRNRWYHVVYTFDSASNTHKLYRDGAEVATGTNAGTISDQPTALWIGRHSQFDFGTFPGRIDEVRLYGIALTGPEIFQRFISGGGIPQGDSDADGLPDAWEAKYFGNLSQAGAGDPDGDGLSNLDEFLNGTNPTLADTDGDGFGDGAEVSAGTNPLDPGSVPGGGPATPSPGGSSNSKCGLGSIGQPGAGILWLALLAAVGVYRRR